MKELQGKTALISGGAEGIGFGIALALGKQGMNIVLGDIDAENLQRAEKRLVDEGMSVLAVALDVTDVLQWQSFAKQATERYGKIHMLVNNAGVSGRGGPVDDTPLDDWNWVLDVNLMGLMYGAQTIIPLIKQHGEGGWLVNVASMAGLGGLPFAGPYTASKFAVVGVSESWHAELQPENIHVSVLCPGFVKTRINHSERNKPAQGGDSSVNSTAELSALANQIQNVIDNGMAPELVGERVVEALNNKELYIFTHPNFRKLVNKRFTAIDAAFERSESSPLLVDVLNENIDDFA